MTASPSVSAATPPRAVIFLTAPCASDIPAPEHQPACLLTLGCASFAERVLDSCARAGLREIDLVASDQPERLRALLGDGWRWGLQLHWHLAKDGATPYGLLRTLRAGLDDSLLIGHGHCWIGADALCELMKPGPMTAVAAQQPADWSGWARLGREQLDAISSHADEDSLADLVLRRGCGRLELAPQQWARAGSAQELLDAQGIACQQLAKDDLPAIWLRYPWGAAHPEAHIHSAAEIRGPVLIGPHCLIERGAVLGPNTVLAADVLVATGAMVHDALVLPNTYVSGSVTLAHVVAQGNAVQNLTWGVRTTLAPGDGLMTELAPQPQAGGSLAMRWIALLVLLLAAPLALALLGWQILRGRQAGWQQQESVRGRDKDGLRLIPLRCAHHGAGFSGWLLGRYGALLDVAQGRRQWFGVRPRNPAQWYALRRDWQLLFEHQPVGFFHAPVWSEPGQADDLEAQAAADAFLAVQTGWRARWQMLDVLRRGFSIASRRS